jgi:hypothetical protein
MMAGCCCENALGDFRPTGNYLTLFAYRRCAWAQLSGKPGE